MLSKYLETLHQQGIFGQKHETVLELGSGCGLLAMAAAMMGMIRILFALIHPPNTPKSHQVPA